MPDRTIDLLSSAGGIVAGYKIVEYEAVTSAEVFQNLLDVLIGNALILCLFAIGIFALATGASLQLRKRDELKWRPIVGFSISTLGEGFYPLLLIKFVSFADSATMIQTYTNYVLFSGIVALILGVLLVSDSRE